LHEELCVELWVISGNQAAGKTTVGRLLAQRFPVAAHVEGDDMQRLLVSGRRWPESIEDLDPQTHDLRGTAGHQHRLRVRNACLLGASFVDAGITAVITDIICGDAFDEMLRALDGRTIHFVMLRPPTEVLRRREVERLPGAHREAAVARGTPVNEFEPFIESAIDAMPRVGLWLDAIDLHPGAMVDLILQGRTAARLDLHHRTR
jgi:adenylate kinase family enzyme